MKNLKMAVTALVILASVTSALAFKTQVFGTGTVFCSQQDCLDNVPSEFILDDGGTENNPCTTTPVYQKTSNGCEQISNPSSHKYTRVTI